VGTDGSIYVSGRTSGALDGQTNNGGTDAFLTKFNTDGTKAWTRLLGTSGDYPLTALTVGLDGSIYVSGRTSGALDEQTNNGGTDAFLTKFNTDGTKSWTRLQGTSGEDYASALTVGLDGSIYVSGSTSGALDGQTNNGGTDAFLTKFNTDGTKAWTKLLGTSGEDSARALTLGIDGSIYAGGYTYGELGGPFTYSGNGDAFLTKFSTDGTKAWTKVLRTSDEDYATALTTGTDGSIYITGHTYGNLDGQISNGFVDTFLTKFDVDGTKLWTKLLGSSGADMPSSITVGTDGSIYVAGFTTGSLDNQTNSGGNDAFFAKYSADGTNLWTKLLGTSGDDVATDLTTGKDGSIYVSGLTYGSLDGRTNSGGADAFLKKFTFSYLPTGNVTISGTFTQGQVLTATNSLADLDGMGTVTYQWQAGSTNIVGATNAIYALTQAEVGKSITVLASYTDGQGTAESVRSASTSNIANINDAPIGTVSVSGTALKEQALTASNNLADADGLGPITYQWQAGGTNIVGATSAAYTLTQAEVGKAITVIASYTDGQGTLESVASSATQTVEQLFQVTAPRAAIDSIGLTPDGMYLVIKSGGVSQMVSIDSTLEFADSVISARDFSTSIDPTPVFASMVNGEVKYVLPELFTGPPSLNLKYQLIDTTPEAVVVGSALNDFIVLQGGGNKAVDGGLGNDVIDGGVGSTFVSGGGGSNTFFLDGRAAGASWSTITDFNLGSDKATIWGWKAGVSKVAVVDGAGGAPGYQGLTLHFENLLPDGSGAGVTNSNLNSITLSNKTLSDFGASSLCLSS
jgi:hypothetical protein